MHPMAPSVVVLFAVMFGLLVYQSRFVKVVRRSWQLGIPFSLLAYRMGMSSWQLAISLITLYRYNSIIEIYLKRVLCLQDSDFYPPLRFYARGPYMAIHSFVSAFLARITCGVWCSDLSYSNMKKIRELKRKIKGLRRILRDYLRLREPLKYEFSAIFDTLKLVLQSQIDELNAQIYHIIGVASTVSSY